MCVLTAGQHREQHQRGGPQVGGRGAVRPLGRRQHLGRRVRHRAAHARQQPLARAVPATRKNSVSNPVLRLATDRDAPTASHLT